ncbi:MAG: tetratricopeptide repeat protein [Planctomycetes bacterium]|nr:tetratricopeptide repeat protein [Planctomycetota bacterium]
MSRVSALVALLCCGGVLSAQDDEYGFLLEGAQRKLLAGELSSAESLLEEIVAAVEEEPESSRPPADLVLTARMLFGEIRSRRGEYEEALELLSGLGAEFLAGRQPRLLRARILGRVGRHAEAGALLQSLLEVDDGDREARHELGESCWRDGRRAEAMGHWQANAEAARPDDALQLAFVGRSMWRLGGRANLERASGLLVESMKRDDGRPEARTTYGILKFEAYGEAQGFPSGEKDLEKVLEKHGDYEPALLAMYRLRSANGILDRGKTEGYLQRALAQNPNCVEALMQRGSNILDDRRFDDAAEWLDRALTIDATDREVLAHRAVAAWLLDDQDGYVSFRARALAGDQNWAEVDRIHGDHLVSLYRFGDAVPFYAAALAADAEHIPSLHGMARALIYTGDGIGALELLERAKKLAGGINDPWRNNAMAAQELLDRDYTTIESGPFRLTMHRDDAELLGTYLMPMYLEAAETLGAKYGMRPKEPITVEVFHTWDDFSVRTTGFRGFTALGACFGPFITLVSPGDNDVRRQEFMWEATVWHEFTHVLTLGLSRHRVPRWLTEGFSVYEEKVRDRTWERGMDRELFDALHNRDLPPLRLLNRLFRGSRILFGYYQGGLTVELIVRKHGFDKAVELVRAFGDDLGLEAACQRALGMSSRELDTQVLDFVEHEKLRGMRLVPRYDEHSIQRMLVDARRDRGDLDARIGLAWAFLQHDNPVDAGRWLAEVMRVDPQYGPAMLVRAEMLARRKEAAAAIEQWRAGFAAGAEDFDSRIRCGQAMLATGDESGAEDQWQRAKACWPACTEQENAPELLLARLYRDQGDRIRAQMEMKSYCRRTARAFTPRMTLAQFEREEGHRQEEARYLEECNRIDPFHRSLHVQLGEAYEALDKPALAAREFEMAAAVPPQLDRRYLARDMTAPAADDPAELEERGDLWLRAAKLRHRLGDDEKAAGLLARILQSAPRSSAADDVEALRREWHK